MKPRKLIIGLGTGRCGTDSLTKVLNKQKDVKAYHEYFFLGWEDDFISALVILNQLLRDPEGEFIATVAFYWLNYVPKLCALLSDVKFVCLWRDKEEVVESFFEHTKNRNLWTAPTSEHWDLSNLHAIDPLMMSFPKYDLPKREAIAKYWDEYDRKAKVFAALHPSNFMYINVNDALNTKEGMKKMFDFVRIPEENRDYCVGLTTNKRNEITAEVELLREHEDIDCSTPDCKNKASRAIKIRAFSMLCFTCEECERDTVLRLTRKRKELT